MRAAGGIVQRAECTTKIVHFVKIDLVYYLTHTINMRIAMNLRIDGHSPIPIRRQLTEQLRHVIEGGGVPRDQALPSIRELAGFLGVNPNTVARVIDDLKRSGYVEARRGKGVVVAPAPPARPSPHPPAGLFEGMGVPAAAPRVAAHDFGVGGFRLARDPPPPPPRAGGGAPGGGRPP